MNKKPIIIGSIIVLIFLFAFLGFYFHNNIKTYIEEESWIYTEPYIEKNIELASIYEGGKKLFTISDNNLKVYNNQLNQVIEENINSSNVIFKSKGSYTSFLSTDKNFFRLYKDNNMLWNKSLSSDLKQISVNKNGLVSICFIQTGYKSGVKLFDTKGEELLNIYLASTYAVDAELSSDNKTLYVAEVDFNGINAISLVKIVDVLSKTFTEIKLNSDEIIVDIEFTDTNSLLVQSNKALYSIDIDNTIHTLYNFEENDVFYSTIKDFKSPLVIEKGDYILRKITDEEERYITLNNEPQIVDVAYGKVALLFKNEVWILDGNCKVVKKCDTDEGVVDLKIFNNGRNVALIYNKKIALINI